MKLLSYRQDGLVGIAIETDGEWRSVDAKNGLPKDIVTLLKLSDWQNKLNSASTTPLDLSSISYLPPTLGGEKILCVGLNYQNHVDESPYKAPEYPVFFPRFSSSLIGHRDPLIKPSISDEFDFEGEIAVVIGKTGRHIAESDALSYVAGYTLFNDASVRDFQFKTHQWTMGKNFDGTGACGPWLVTADELPAGADGITLETRINGKVEQHANTRDMIFKVKQLISVASDAMTLRPGDLIVSGTPSGVGFARKPPLFLKAGDVCEIVADGLGVLSNTVANE